MRRRQETFPDWWMQLKATARQREQIRALFTVTRDGYTRWYHGAPRFVCGKTVPLEQVPERWKLKREEIDAEEENREVARDPDAVNLYRDVLSEFLELKKEKIGAARNPIRERTYHNSVSALNAFGRFVVNGRKIGDTNIRDIGPDHFTAYARKFKAWKSSGFDSVVSRVSEFFRWAIEMEFIDRFRPGPEFRRPGKQSIRTERIDLKKSFTPEEVAQLYVAANHVMRCFIALGICAAFNNSDIGNVPRIAIDMDKGVIDFRRLKQGKIRRVIPLPADVTALLKSYVRPDPTDPAWSDLFFITEHGNPYARTKSRTGKWMPSDSVSRLFAKLMEAAGAKRVKGKNFTGLRTTHYNLAVTKKRFDLERKIVMGRAKGSIDFDHYLEDVGMDRLKHYVSFIWSNFKPKIDQLARLTCLPARSL